MLFNSYIFIFLFLPLTLIGWNKLIEAKKTKMALAFLSLMSLWFYGYFNPSYLIILFASIIGNYLLSLWLDYIEKNKENSLKACRRITLILGLLHNLGLLFYFKYYDFFIENLNSIIKTDFNLKHILLPLGISFFTFQQLSYIVDRAWGKATHIEFVKYVAFVTFFPQLIAGPIVLHSELVPEYERVCNQPFDRSLFHEGIIRFVMGLGKKVLLADNLSRVVNVGMEQANYLDTLGVVLSMLCYMLELYFDFSGYSDMAIGLGLMFGIKLPENFDSPYHATSFRDLWKRWHMTLTRFMTTYVYIPLGGSRKGKLHTLKNVFIVFLLSGLWHGADLSFVLWGALAGAVVILDSLGIINTSGDSTAKAIWHLPRWIGLIFSNLCFLFLFIPFRADNLDHAGVILKALFNPGLASVWRLIAPLGNMPESFFMTQVLSRIINIDEGSVNTLIFIVMLTISMLVISAKNAPEIIKRNKDKLWLNMSVVAILIYSIISFSEVSTFIYFNF